MGTQEVSASVPDRALVNQAPAGLGRSGFDPSRGDELRELIEKLRAKRGSPETWLENELHLTRFIAELQDTTRVFCRGEVRIDKGHFPAVLTHNSIYRQTLAWAPSGKKGAMEAHPESNFWSTVPHVGIAREVLAGPETVTVARDSDGSPKGGDACGSVHDSAGRQASPNNQVSETPSDTLGEKA